uniref:Uncharacterized protein n=1 Tax=viral metagenome TaxID=1070528 RepID=A0A6C0DYJ9_9ZZZZ
MSDKQQLFISIMAFYALLSYVIGPMAFYYLRERSLASAGNGFILGSVVSILLWLSVGSNMVK